MKYEEELTEDEKAFINEPLVKKVTRTVTTDETVLVVQTMEFRRQAEVDPETCDTTYGNWEPENGIWEKYEIPVRKGYRPSIGKNGRERTSRRKNLQSLRKWGKTSLSKKIPIYNLTNR